MSNPYQVVREFEAAVAAYTGAPFCVAVSSCSAALMLAVAWHFHKQQAEVDAKAKREGHGMQMMALRPPIEIPKRTYVSVPMSIIHAGGWPTFRDEEWLGAYQLKPLPVWDSARWFSGDMYNQPYRSGAGSVTSWDTQQAMVCTSHHWNKTLGIQQGGTILHDDPEADRWLRMARFDGRQEGIAPKDQKEWIIGHHVYMSPEIAAAGLIRLRNLPPHNAPMPNDPYPDLSTLEIFK